MDFRFVIGILVVLWSLNCAPDEQKQGSDARTTGSDAGTVDAPVEADATQADAQALVDTLVHPDSAISPDASIDATTPLDSGQADRGNDAAVNSDVATNADVENPDAASMDAAGDGCDALVGLATAIWTRPVDITPTGGAGRRPVIAPDGEGGAFVAYLQEGQNVDSVWLQRVDARGQMSLQGAGLLLLQEVSPEDVQVALSPDGSGGAFVAILDSPNSVDNLTLLRVSASGEMLWGAEGSAFLASSTISKAQLVARGSAEVWVVYNALTGTPGLYAQVLDASGLPLWQAPVAIDNNPMAVWNRAESDGVGGAFVAWTARNQGAMANQKVYAAHLDREGVSTWGQPAVVSTESEEIEAWGVDLEPDGSGGLYLAWHYTDIEGILPPTKGIFAAHLNSAGAPSWPQGGVQVEYYDRNTQHFPKIATTVDGPMVFWTEVHTGRRDVRVQRIESGGTLAFDDSKEVAARISEKGLAGVSTDRCGGALATWSDLRQGPSGQALLDVGLQRLDSRGESTFEPSGLMLGDQDSKQLEPTLTKVGPLSFFVAWVTRLEDSGGSPYGLVQAQRIDIE